MSEIADLLLKAKDAHVLYREALPRRVASGDTTVAVPGEAELAGACLVTACRFRSEAHVLDPDRRDPAWADFDPSMPHDLLLYYYVEQLTR